MDVLMKTGSALLLLAMIIFLFPRLRSMIDNSPKGTADDWATAALLIGGVMLFVWVLMKAV